MFVVLSSQNALSTQIAPAAILFLTEVPGEALAKARAAITHEEDSAFIGSVHIYNIEPNKGYSLSEYDGKAKEGQLLMFSVWKHLDSNEPVEKFYGIFKAQKRRRLINSKEYTASEGKFRAAVLFDSDEEWQIYDDVDTREEAFQLCSDATIKGYYPFQVFNDKGEEQVFEGKLKELVTS